MSPARDRFASVPVARLATVDAAGQPHLVPMVFALDGDTIYSAVDAKPKRSTALRRLANVTANPRVSVLADHYDDDWTALWWVRADGTARVVPVDAPAGRRALGLLVARYRQYEKNPPIGPVLVVDVARWVQWTAS